MLPGVATSSVIRRRSEQGGDTDVEMVDYGECWLVGVHLAHQLESLLRKLDGEEGKEVR